MQEEYWDVYDINRHKTTKIIKRGQRLKEDEYHLFVQVWLVNKEGLFLCQERSENISWPLMWCANGGNAKMNEDAYTCARREIMEELKIDIDKLSGFLFDSSTYYEDNQNYFCESFVYFIDKEIKDIDYQKEEIKSLKYMRMNEIRDLMAKKIFFTYEDEYLKLLNEIVDDYKNNKLEIKKYKKEGKL